MLARCARCQATFTADRFGLVVCPHCGSELLLADPSAPAKGPAPAGPASAPPPEAAVGLAIVIAIFRTRGAINVDEVRALRE